VERATPDRMNASLLKVPPSDRTIVGLLVLAVVVAAIRLPASPGPMLIAMGMHGAMLCGFVAAVAVMARNEDRPFVQWLRPIASIAVIFSLYTSLGKLGVAAMPYLADGSLSRIDEWLFGFNPTFAIERYQTAGWVEFFSFVYGAFIPYINLSLALGCLGRPPGERDCFLTGWVFTYAISYLGYVFVPAHGPVVYHAADYAAGLSGGFFYRVVVLGNEMTGGLQGVFPSLHVGGSVYLCLFDLKTNRLRGLTYLPLVLLIYVATIFLRYHYIVDLVAGTIIASVSIPLGRWAFGHWVSRRRSAGLVALPGAESDGLPIFLGPDPNRAAPVLSAD
jgi:hypothetical protein